MTMNYYIVDVFAESKYAGNQLAVFLGEDVKHLSDAEMLQIAREINYSETTFITSTEMENDGYNVRIFTPKKELPFAGHPTLGTAYIIQKAMLQQPIEKVILNLKVGQIPVTFIGESEPVLWMKQNAPIFDKKLTAEQVAPVLNLDINEIDHDYPIQEVSTGVPFIIVPLKTHKALKKAKVNVDKLFALVEKTEAKCILIFCPETYHPENQLSVRMFAHYLGIPEDPATGSANGCLAGYLAEYHYFGDDQVNVRVEQGYEIDRASLLLLKSEKKDGIIDVCVGGKVVMVAKGEFI
jgi:trans-2,3-dihydro-3-hydroxyanthranilate isomerase